MTIGRGKDAGGREAAGGSARRGATVRVVRPAQKGRGKPTATAKKVHGFDLPGRGEPVAVEPKPVVAAVAMMKDALAASRSTRAKVPDLAQARQRLASLPVGFTDWVGSEPAWPADVPEIIGPRAREAGCDK